MTGDPITLLCIPAGFGAVFRHCVGKLARGRRIAGAWAMVRRWARRSAESEATPAPEEPSAVAPARPQTPAAVDDDGARLVCIPTPHLCDAWAAIAEHVGQMGGADAGALMREVSEGRAALWCVYAVSERRFFDVTDVAVVGIHDGAVSVLASTPCFARQRPDFISMALLAEAHRTGCYRVANYVDPDTARRAHALSTARGAYGPPLFADGFHEHAGVH
jgi:hypothetical protein